MKQTFHLVLKHYSEETGRIINVESTGLISTSEKYPEEPNNKLKAELLEEIGYDNLLPEDLYKHCMFFDWVMEGF